jgi:hypothetical protein
MRLIINDERVIDDPSDRQLRSAIESLGSEQFVVLIEDEDQYVQVFKDEAGVYHLEYRAGSEDQHFVADSELISVADVTDAFSLFLQNSPELHSRWEWQKMDFDAEAFDASDDDDQDDQEAGEEVEYNGVMMAAGWPEQIEAAQELSSISVDGKVFKRIAYGSEQGPTIPDQASPPSGGVCGDCGVLPGQFHVPGCDLEECPQCHVQLISCDCEID